MLLKRLVLLMSVLVLAFGVVACGDDEEEPASGGTTTEETTTTEDSGGTEEDTTGEEDTGGGVSDEQVQAAVDQCKSAIQAQTQLSDDLISDLEELCDKAASGDIEDAQEASVEVCKKIAEEMVPDEAAREQVIASCEQAAP